MSRFSDMLSFLRRRCGLTQQDLADKVGMSRSSIAMYEKGKREPSFELAEVFADIFNVNMDTLMGKENVYKTAPTPVSESGLSTEAKEVAKAYDKATEKEQSTVRFVLSDYLQDTAEPKVLAARTSGEPIKDDPSTFIIEGEDPDIL